MSISPSTNGAAYTPVTPTPARPHPWTPGDYSKIPQQLKDLPQWVCWKLEPGKDGELTKIPYNPKTGNKAKANDSTTWTTFKQAVEAADPLSGNDYNGIGFEFGGTHLGGIDFDHMRDAKGVCDPYGLAILKLLGEPYTEQSPSGTGFHAPYECDGLPKGKRKFSTGHTGIEIYHGTEPGRFFTCTGNKLFGDGIPKIEDLTLPYFLISQNEDKNFKALWLGDISAFGGDHSKADFALMCKLAKLTKNDPMKMEEFFGESALGQRDKWTDREDYRQRTIKAAISDNTVDISPTASVAISGTFDQIAPKKIKWLWLHRFAQKLNMLVGNPDIGKGLITYYLIACITTGRNWFDAKNTLPPSEALLLSDEEDEDDTIVPRLIAAGADRSKVRWLKMSATKKDGTKMEKTLQLDNDAAVLEDFIDQHPNIRLVVIDPVSNYLGKAKMIDEQAVRAVLMPLKEIANRRGVAIVAVMHLNKKVELDAIHRISGAVAFVGVARMVWLVHPKPHEDGTDSDETLMIKVKGNIVQRKLKGLSFLTKVHDVPIENDTPAETPYAEWLGEIDQRANDLMGKSSKPETSHNVAGRPDIKTQKAIKWVCEYLQDGKDHWSDTVLKDAHKSQGITSTTLRNAYEKVGGTKPFKRGTKWYWKLEPMNAMSEDLVPQQSDLVDVEGVS